MDEEEKEKERLKLTFNVLCEMSEEAIGERRKMQALMATHFTT